MDIILGFNNVHVMWPAWEDLPLMCQMHHSAIADPGGPVVIILSSGSEVRRFDPGRGRWIFSEHKNPEYDFFQKGSKAVGPMS